MVSFDLCDAWGAWLSVPLCCDAEAAHDDDGQLRACRAAHARSYLTSLVAEVRAAKSSRAISPTRALRPRQSGWATRQPRDAGTSCVMNERAMRRVSHAGCPAAGRLGAACGREAAHLRRLVPASRTRATRPTVIASRGSRERGDATRGHELVLPPYHGSPRGVRSCTRVLRHGCRRSGARTGRHGERRGDRGVGTRPGAGGADGRRAR